MAVRIDWASSASSVFIARGPRRSRRTVDGCVWSRLMSRAATGKGRVIRAGWPRTHAATTLLCHIVRAGEKSTPHQHRPVALVQRLWGQCGDQIRAALRGAEQSLVAAPAGNLAVVAGAEHLGYLKPAVGRRVGVDGGLPQSIHG